MNNKQPDSFKSWVKSHDPKLSWNWNDPVELNAQLCDVISESGHINLKVIFDLLHPFYESGLTQKQNTNFINYKA